MKNSNKLKKQKTLRGNIGALPNLTANLATVEKVLIEMRNLQAREQGVSVSTPEPRHIEVIPPAIVKGLLAIANSYFRAKKKMLDPTTGEPHEAMARVYKDIDRICRNLEDIGFKIKDHTGDPYDDGQPMKVITSGPRPDATRKYVIETLLPTIYWNDRIIQHGEIEIAVPATPATN